MLKHPESMLAAFQAHMLDALLIGSHKLPAVIERAAQRTVQRLEKLMHGLISFCNGGVFH